jgi:hypothetical protein
MHKLISDLGNLGLTSLPSKQDLTLQATSKALFRVQTDKFGQSARQQHTVAKCQPYCIQGPGPRSDYTVLI